MTSGLFERTDADYDVWLTAKSAEWVKENPAVADRLRLLITTLMGMPRAPTDKVSMLALEMTFRQGVQILKGWPTREEFLRGDDAK